MPAFLSNEWIAALDAAARADVTLRDASEDLAVAIQHEIDVDDGDQPVIFHVEFDHGSIAARPGTVPSGTAVATIIFRQDRATATAIARGELSAQRAFMSGRLRVDGDLSVLVERRDLLVSVGDAFATVRADTDWPDAEKDPHA